MSTKTEDKPIAHAGADSSPRCAVSTGSAPKATAARLARAVFACGDDVRGRCKRIQFRLRDWPDDEISGGGLCETALADLLYRELRRKTNTKITDAEEQT